MNKSCFLVGSLENFAGTVPYMKRMIKDNRLVKYMSNIGMINAETGEPAALFADSNVEGATFRVTKIKLIKSSVQPILDQEKIAEAEAANHESLKEVKKVSEIFAVNSTFRNTLEEQTALLKENILLKASRDTVRSVQVRFPGGEAHVNLDQGRRATFGDASESPSWMVDIPSEQGRISLLDICISLSGFPLPVSGEFAMVAQIAPDGSLVRLPYNSTVSTYFVFDQSWEDIDIENVLGGRPLFWWLRVQLAGGSNERVRYSVPNYNGPELFMTLIFLNFRIDMVSQSLGALGIDFSPTEEGGDDEEDDLEG